MLHFNPAELRAVVAEVRANQCALVLTNDNGVYLMPAVGERNATGRIKHLAYATGVIPTRMMPGMKRPGSLPAATTLARSWC